MPANYQNIQKRLQAFDFAGLFTQELMWNHYITRDLVLTIDGVTYTLKPVAQRGMAVLECVPPTDAQFPKHATRRKIDTQVSKTAREHIIIFHDNAKTVQWWQWVKREAGKPSACRGQSFYKGQSGDALVQKIQGIAFALEDEPNVAASVARVGAAFDVEKVTKKFYERFKDEHDAFLKFTKDIPAEKLQRWYASVMLNRLMFIYFIQKKGFLGGDQHYLTNKLAESQHRGKDKFYRDFLCPLFFEGFAKREEQRTAETNCLLGRVPYLNGGLFLKHQIELNSEHDGKPIEVPDKAFERIFAFFEQYDWHLDDRLTRTGREINPDVLGYVFEKYINQKEMGAYYTKEDITEYIGKNTIIPAIFDMARKSCRIAFEGEHSVWRLLEADPDRYIHAAMLRGMDEELPEHIAAGLKDVSKRGDWNKSAEPQYALPTETRREVVARRTRCEEIRSKLAAGEIRSINDLITYNLDIRRFAEEVIANCEGPELLRAFYKAIRNISVLDPACGSGAFLFAALTILERLYDTCLVRMQAFVDDLDRSGEKHSPEKFKDFRDTLQEMNDKSRHPSPRYFILKSIILKNLYGVDIMEEATEICKLRLFLKLVAQVNPGEKIEPLPDIDFNIRSGNTLVGYATEAELDKALSRLGHGDKKAEIEERAEAARKAFKNFQDEQVTGGTGSPEDVAQWKADVNERLEELRHELDDYLAGDYNVKKGDKAQFIRWRESHQPFHCFVEFFGIMRQGGFDAIIGNPPYVEYRPAKVPYRIQDGLYASSDTGNLYAFFMERSAILLRNDGHFGMIVPVSLLGLDDAVTIRNYLVSRYSRHFCSSYSIRPAKLFEGVDQRLCIYIGNRQSKDQRISTTRYHHWSAEERDALFPTLRYQDSYVHPRLNRIVQVGCSESARILQKLEQKSTRTIAHYYASASTARYLLHYHRSPRYWIRGMDFEQYFKSPTRSRSVHHFRDLHFIGEYEAKFAGDVLNSTIFFHWFLLLGNGRNLTGVDVQQFPVGDLVPRSSRVQKLFDMLMADYKKNSFVRERQDCEFQEFRPNKSKPIIDEIDRLLAQYYSLADEEVDFITNFEIKYRMGGDAEEEDESEGAAAAN